MNKTVRVAFTVALILAIASIGFANATPKTLKEANLLYSTSENPDKWLPVAGNQVSDFKLKLDGNPDTWYYLDIKFIKPEIADSEILFGFFLVPPTDPAFWTYWTSKGVTASAPMGPGPLPNWQWVMWRIINGRFPMFGLHCDGAGNYDLYDALMEYAFDIVSPLRLNGDYPKGAYSFTCKLPAGSVLDGTVMTIDIR
jgi:hypothetical protein